MNNYYNDLDTKPENTIIISDKTGVRQLPKESGEGGRLPAQNAAQVIQAILSAPAPVPGREPAAIRRERIEGADEKSTPVMRAVASIIRSAKYLALVAVLGMVAYVAVPSVSGVVVTGLTVVSMAVVMLVFDTLEYSHSQAGVERLRTVKDHKLETLHEQNRHEETIESIKGDITLKMRLLDVAAGYAQLPDKERGK